MKQKPIEELNREYENALRRLIQEQHKKQRLENRLSYYEKGERQKRAHRLITRGAAVESVMPMAKLLTGTEFYAWAEKVSALPQVNALLIEAVNGHNRAEQEGR